MKSKAQETATSALDYSERGLFVLPVNSVSSGRCSCGNTQCKSPGKHPIGELVPRGVNDASCNPEVIRQWWTLYPDANIGVAMGAASGVWVLDVDGEQGEESIRALEAQYGPFPDTVEAITGGGGRHILFSWSDDAAGLKNTVGLMPGLDIRGEGAYIVVPPSTHASGSRYEWDAAHHPDDVPFAPAPAWLIRFFADLRSQTPEVRIAEPITEGRRNATLASLAGTMRRRGMTEAEIDVALQEINRSRCTPPLDELEVRAIAKSVSQYPPAPSDEPDQKRGKPCIVVNGRHLRDLADQALKALVDANESPMLFVRSGRLVRITRDENRRPLIENLSEASFTGLLDRRADFVKASKGELTPAHPPQTLVRDLLGLGEWPFPPLEAIVEAPSLRPNGTVLQTPGYDAETKLYYVPSPDMAGVEVPANLVREDAVEAVGHLADLFSDFPMSDDETLANLLAMTLTAVLRPAINGCVPIVVIDAPQQGSGKTLAATVPIMIATGRAPVLYTVGRDDEEWRKLITSALGSGSTHIVFDNLTVPLEAPSLAAAITSRTWSDRLLGRNQSATYPQRATWFVTGNNVCLRGDMPRRCYRIRFDPQTSQPWKRTGFQHPRLTSWVLENRASLLTAILTMARAWYAAGEPAPSGNPLGGFEEWTRVIGGMLQYANVEGFLGNLDSMYEETDDENGQWTAFLGAIQATFGDAEFKTADVVAAARDDDSVRQALPEGCLGRDGEPDPRRMGKAFTQRRDVCHGDTGLRIVRRGESHSACVWRVEAGVQ